MATMDWTRVGPSGERAIEVELLAGIVVERSVGALM